MAHARTPLAADELTSSLIAEHPTVPTVAIVLSTRPEAHLRSGDRRRLARAVSGAERRLARTVPGSSSRRRLVRRLWALAETASRGPARQGVALLATPQAGRIFPLHYPAIDRILVGSPPTFPDLVAETWGLARVAVLHLTARGARLLACEGGAPWEPRPPWDPLDGRYPDLRGVLRRAHVLTQAALPPRTPLVVAGDDRLVRAYLACDLGPRPALVLPGDHSETSPAGLISLAKRALRASLDADQRVAMVDVVLAVERGIAWRGVTSDDLDTIEPSDHLVIEVGAAADDIRLPEAAGSLTVVPDGFLAHHDRAVLLPGPRPDTGPFAAESASSIRTDPRSLTLTGGRT